MPIVPSSSSRVAAALVLALGLTTASGQEPAAVGPLKVTVDTADAPDLAAWGAEAQALAEHWYPKVVDLLKSDGFTPPTEVTLAFRKDYRGVAEASQGKITISPGYVTKHPEDKGMVVHELTHVIQSYPRNRSSGWVVEGIADYVRFFHFEPETPLRIADPDKASYRDSYRTAAKFLRWVETTHDKAIVRRLNAALRAGKYDKGLFKEGTSKDLDALWAEFIEAEKAKGGA